VTVEAAFPGPKPVVWRFPRELSGNDPLVRLEDVEGLRLKGFTFDGGDRARTLISLTGECPGLVLEDLQLTGFTRKAIQMANCTGTEQQPVLLTRLRARATQKTVEAFLLLFASPPVRTSVASQHIRVRECRFEGPCSSAVVIEGSALDVELRRNRFFQAEEGVHAKKAVALQLTLHANTFCEIPTALRFEQLPTGAENRVNIIDNLFSQVKEALATVDGPADPAQAKILTCSGNVFDKVGSKEGNLKVDARPVEFPPLRTDPAGGDKAFLSYRQEGPLAREGNPGWTPEP
jgi:hypothetical protein